jgi:tetratricopeptide (TPR) repeat protein
VFLERAAVLHSDALVFGRRFPRPPDDTPPPARRSERIDGRRVPINAERPPPLLTNETVVLTRDGQVIGEAPADWNLPFARSVLDELFRPSALPVTPQDRDFAAEWYHVMAAYLFASGMNGDAADHLYDAARVLPDDPRVLFDRGTYAETFGLPIYQALQQEASARPNSFIVKLPAEDKTNAEAERLYRRALQLDPSYHEARVRLARLLDRRGQREEAAKEIAQVLDARLSDLVGFYALTVAGRVAAGRGHYDEALEHYRAALALHPRAQSALLGASHAALLLADVPGTLAPIEQLGSESGAEADPWLDYQLGPGRDINDLMQALWARIAR